MDDFYNDFGFDIINQNNMDDLNDELYDFGLESTNDYLNSSMDEEMGKKKERRMRDGKD